MRPPFAAGTVARAPRTAERGSDALGAAGIEGVISAYRLYADGAGTTHLEPLDLGDRAWENGPGEFKGVGGSVLGDAEPGDADALRVRRPSPASTAPSRRWPWCSRARSS